MDPAGEATLGDNGMEDVIVEEVTQHDRDEPPNYFMFAVTCAVVLYSLFVFMKKRKKQVNKSQSESKSQSNSVITSSQRPDRYYNGGSSSGGGSSTMVEAPPSNENKSPRHKAAMTSKSKVKIVEIIGSNVLKDNVMVRTTEALAKTQVLGIYFSAHWCGPCKTFTPRLATFYKNIQKTHGEGTFEIIFVSSDRSQDAFKKYFATMPWLALPFANSAQFPNLRRHYRLKGIPNLIFVSPITGQVLLSEGRKLVMQDPKGSTFPFGIVDPNKPRTSFASDGHKLGSDGDTTESSGISLLELRQRRLDALSKRSASKKTDRNAADSMKKDFNKREGFRVIKILEIEQNVQNLELRNDEDEQLPPLELVKAANVTLAKVGATFRFSFGTVKIALRTPTRGQLHVGFVTGENENGDNTQLVDELPNTGLTLHFSSDSLCVGSVCMPWLKDPVPANNVVDTQSDAKVLHPSRKTGGANVATPPWLRGEMEAPLGTETIDGCQRGVFTLEQQSRLGIDKFGQKIRVSDEQEPLVDPKWKTCPPLTEDDFMLEDKTLSSPHQGQQDNYKCPVGVQHIHGGMQEMTAYFREADRHGLAVMVDFYATWCGPCRAISPFYDRLANMYAGRMVFLKVDCGGRQPGAPNMDIRSFAAISAFPTFQVYRGGVKVAEVRGGRTAELERLAADFSKEGASDGQGGGGGGAKSAIPPLQSVYNLFAEEFKAKNLISIGSATGVVPSGANHLNMNKSKAKKILNLIEDFVKTQNPPMEKPLDFDVISTLVKECLSQSVYWHTPPKSLTNASHSKGVCEIARALLHKNTGELHTWWSLNKTFTLLDIAEQIFQHPDFHLICNINGPAKSLRAAIVHTAQRFCRRMNSSAWLETTSGRAVCKRILSCLTLMTAFSDVDAQKSRVADDGSVSVKSFPWLEVAVNITAILDVSVKIVNVLTHAAKSAEDPTPVKKIEWLLRDSSRLLYNISAIMFHSPLRLKGPSKDVVSILNQLIDGSMNILHTLQILSAKEPQLPSVVMDGQLFALRAICIAIVQVNGIYPPSASRALLTGLSLTQGQAVWQKAKEHLGARAGAAFLKANTHIQVVTNKVNGKTGVTEAQDSKLATKLRNVAAEALKFSVSKAPFAGQNTRPAPNPWAT